jgi:hypothetical protein
MQSQEENKMATTMIFCTSAKKYAEAFSSFELELAYLAKHLEAEDAGGICKIRDLTQLNSELT